MNNLKKTKKRLTERLKKINSDYRVYPILTIGLRSSRIAYGIKYKSPFFLISGIAFEAEAVGDLITKEHHYLSSKALSKLGISRD